jgi:hypothetical protein
VQIHLRSSAAAAARLLIRSPFAENFVTVIASSHTAIGHNPPPAKPAAGKQTGGVTALTVILQQKK